MHKTFYHRLQSTVIASLVSAIVLAFLGPFGTYTEMTFAPRLLYWVCLCHGIGVCMMLCVSFATRACAHPWYSMLPRVFIGAGLAGIPGVAIVIVMYAWMREPELPLTTTRLLQIWGQVTFLGALITLLELWRSGYILHAPKQTRKSTPETAMHLEASTIYATDLHPLLPIEHASAELVSMSMQDHYVEVTTTMGTELILMRFTDAMQKIGHVDGLRIHRSHWVAAGYIQDLHKAGHTAKVTLKDGRQLPVSRTYVDRVRLTLNQDAPTRHPQNA